MSKETDALLHHPDVTRVIRAVLMSTGLRDHLLEDGIQQTYLLALKSTRKNPPDTILRWQKVCRAVAKKHGISELRKRIAHAKRNVGPTGDVDDHAANAGLRPRWEAHDAKKALEVLFLLLDEGVFPANFEAILDAVQAGEKHAEIARQAGLTEAAVGKRLWAARVVFRQRLLYAGLGGLAVVGMVYAAYMKVETNHVVRSDRPDAGTTLAPTSRPPEVLVDTHAAQIAAMRAEAEEAARKSQWQVCAKLFYGIDRLRGPSDAAVDPLKTRCDEEFARSLDTKTYGDAGARRKK